MQLEKTLASFCQYKDEDFVFIVVDDGSPEEIRLPDMQTGEDIFHRTEWFAQKKFITLDEINHPELTEWLKKYPYNFKQIMK
jgi:hypothetical protein